MIANLFNQANRFFSSSESKFSQHHKLNFNQIALILSILMYGLSLIYLVSFLSGDILKSIAELTTLNPLINQSQNQ